MTRKQNKTNQIVITLEAEYKKFLDQVAYEEAMKPSAYVKRMLIKNLRNKEKIK